MPGGLAGASGRYFVVVGLSVRAAEGRKAAALCVASFAVVRIPEITCIRFGVERFCFHPLSCLVSLLGGLKQLPLC